MIGILAVDIGLLMIALYSHLQIKLTFKVQSNGVMEAMVQYSVDLTISYGNWKSNSLSYPKVDIPATFNADDYEVFQVIKK